LTACLSLSLAAALLVLFALQREESEEERGGRGGEGVKVGEKGMKASPKRAG